MTITTTLPFEYEDEEHKEKVIELQNVSYHYSPKEPPVLQDITLHLDKNEFVCILGPSGCGKSSLLNIIAGFQRPTSGEISLNGVTYSKPNPDVGVVFQQHNLFPWMKIKDNVGFGLKMQGVPKKRRTALVDHYLHLVQLDSAGNLLPHQLSGGMQQRAAIARTLAADPKVILMDEPFSSLDAITRETMQQHLISIWKKTKKTIFFITHDVDEALLLGTRILVMQPNPGRMAIDITNPLTRLNQNDSNNKDYLELRAHLISIIKKGERKDKNDERNSSLSQTYTF